MSEQIMKLQNMLEHIQHRMIVIGQVSLEREEYNTLYLALENAKNNIISSMMAQAEIDKIEREALDAEKMHD